jgi:hypothetical protein
LKTGNLTGLLATACALWAWLSLGGRLLPWSWRRTFYRDDGSPYMVRYQLLVMGKLLRVYVNHTLQPDHDSRLHTHPYRASWSLKLLGYYAEALTPLGNSGPSSGVRIPGLFSRIPCAHRIVWLSRPEGVWTLMIGWRRELPWGFLNEDGTLEERP